MNCQLFSDGYSDAAAQDLQFCLMNYCPHLAEPSIVRRFLNPGCTALATYSCLSLAQKVDTHAEYIITMCFLISMLKTFPSTFRIFRPWISTASKNTTWVGPRGNKLSHAFFGVRYLPDGPKLAGRLRSFHYIYYLLFNFRDKCYFQ